MALSSASISSIEDTLNRIATELILATPGSDDGLVPTYSLLSQLLDSTGPEDPLLLEAGQHVKMTLDGLLDNSSPFDGRTLDYVTEFTSWSQKHMLNLRHGHETEPFPAAPWIEGASDSNKTSEPADGFHEHIDWSVCDDILNQIATELILAHPGSDDGLVPIYSLLNELLDKTDEHPVLANSLRNLKHTLDFLLDNARSFDSRTLDYIGSFSTWAQNAFNCARRGEPCEAFPTIDGESEPQFLDDEESTPGFPEPDPTEAPVEDFSDDQPDDAEAIQDFPITAVPEARSLPSEDPPSPPEPASQGDDRSFNEIPPDDQPDPSAVAEISALTDVLLDLGSEEDREILGEFHTEALEHLEQIEAALLVLENDPRNADSLASIFRSFHTIKGVAGFLHLVPIQALAHDVESLLDYARNGKLALDSSMITLILQSQDTIQALVDQITLALEKGQAPDRVIPVSHLIAAVRQAGQRGLAIASGKAPAPRTSAPKPAPAPSAKAAKPVEAPKPPSLFAGDSDLEPPSAAFEDEAEDPAPSPKALPRAVGAPRPPAPNAANAANNNNASRSTIRVNTAKLDNLMDMVGELVIVQSQLSESGRTEVNLDDNSNLGRNIAQLQRITRELQHTSMSLRLVPIKPTFQKVGRLVRDLASSFRKKVNLVVEGEDTELDRNVVEQIGDPLVHMVRNSLDHGLEKSAQDRIAAGKPEAGTVALKAYHLGSNIVIELSDDGRGIDPQKILAKARKNGLVPENVEPPRADILNLIFEPGFSTAEKVTDVSGRGVGMDVVRRNIEKLRGKVELESEVGVGTTFKIKLPLTTAIIDGLVVRVGEDKFILPTTSVKVALRPNRKQISTIKGKSEVLDLRGKTIPLVRLHRIFGIETQVQQHWEGIVVIIETIGRPYGLLVDEMLNKQEVVIKSLGSLMQNISGVSGGAILGDGTIALIIDPFSLVSGEK